MTKRSDGPAPGCGTPGEFARERDPKAPRRVAPNLAGVQTGLRLRRQPARPPTVRTMLWQSLSGQDRPNRCRPCLSTLSPVGSVTNLCIPFCSPPRSDASDHPTPGDQNTVSITYNSLKWWTINVVVQRPRSAQLAAFKGIKCSAQRAFAMPSSIEKMQERILFANGPDKRQSQSLFC